MTGTGVRTRLIIAALAAVVAAGLGLGIAGFGRPGNTQSTGDNQAALTSIQTGCQQWLDGSPAEPGTTQWCSEMTQWMDGYMNQYGVGPQTMWGDPARLGAICEDWLKASPPSDASTDPTSWCDAMLSWMDANVGSWSGRGSWGAWMQSGPMGSFGAPTDPASSAPSPSASSSQPSSSGAGGGAYGDSDRDGDCAPGYGDADHDDDCGAGSAANGFGPGQMMGPG